MDTTSTGNNGVRRVTAAAAIALASDTGRTPLPVWFDVRDRAAFDRSRIDRAEHLAEADFPAVLARLARNTPLVIYCYHGHASQEYARMFSDFGFGEVYSVDGGFEALSEALRAPAAPEPALAAPLAASSGEPTDFSGKFLVGDLVYSIAAIHNDGGVPGAGPDELLASPGSRGVIIRKGRLEADESRLLYVACFERSDGTLGPPVGCLPDELTQEPPAL